MKKIFLKILTLLKKQKKCLDENKEFDVAFICASGARSEIAANYFIENYKNIFHIPDGILGKIKMVGFFRLPIESYIDK